ncbi:MAG TPA: class I SAM-dependent methyltransferase [Dehalococcoidia bacterium]|nr:class I SAM-dependent methyltransferase [Dehalococcoidia bacterium]
MSASERHDAMAAGYAAQRERVAAAGDMWAGCAGSFRPNLDAPLSAVQQKAASFIRAEDVLIDVGGGAGRMCVPLASRCREVVCIDPSPAMGVVFEEVVRDAGVANARFVAGAWPEVDGVEGDVALVSHVTYFVPAIVPFIEKLNEATRRRVVVMTRSAAPPNQVAAMFELFRGEPFARVPGYEELRAVLAEMRIDADVIDAGPANLAVTAPTASGREETVKGQVDGALRLGWLRSDEADAYRDVLDQHFDELFAETEQGYRPRNTLDTRELLITWETAS